MNKGLSICYRSLFLIAFFLACVFQGEQARAALSVRQAAVKLIAGPYFGNGLVISWDGKPAILTNHHLVRGQEEIAVHFGGELGAGVNAKAAAQIIEAFPALDLAVLSLSSLPAKINSAALLDIARSTLQFECSGGASCRWEGTYRQLGGKIEVLAHSYIATRNAKAEFEELQMVDPLDRIDVATDYFVSGIYETILQIPTFGRPGISGSGVYHGETLVGLTTVIHRDMASIVFAIPVTEIAAKIQQRMNAKEGSSASDLSREAARCRDLWQQAIRDSASLEFGLRVPARSGGGKGDGEGKGKRREGKGRTGGGDLGSGGDGGIYGNLEEVGSRLWTIEFPPLGFGRRQATEATVLNPFHIHDSFLEIDGQRILAIKENGYYKTATLPRYCRLLIGRKDFELVTDTPANRQELFTKRVGKRTESEVLRWLRVWEKVGEIDGGPYYVNKFPLMGGAFTNGILDFSRASLVADLSHPIKYYWNIPNLQIDLGTVPRSGDHKELHLHFGRHPDRYLSLLLEEMQLGIWLPRDLSEINLFETPELNFSREAVQAATKTGRAESLGLQFVFNLKIELDESELARLTDLEKAMLALVQGSSNSTVHHFIPLIEREDSLQLVSEGAQISHYVSPANDDLRAIAVFNSEDLTVMNRLLVRKEGLVLELSRCHQVLSLCEFKDHPQGQNFQRALEGVGELFDLKPPGSPQASPPTEERNFGFPGNQIDR